MHAGAVRGVCHAAVLSRIDSCCGPETHLPSPGEQGACRCLLIPVQQHLYLSLPSKVTHIYASSASAGIWPLLEHPLLLVFCNMCCQTLYDSIDYRVVLRYALADAATDPYAQGHKVGACVQAWADLDRPSLHQCYSRVPCTLAGSQVQSARQQHAGMTLARRHCVVCPCMQKDECQVLYTLSNNKDDPRLVSLQFGAMSSVLCLHSASEKQDYMTRTLPHKQHPPLHLIRQILTRLHADMQQPNLTPRVRRQQLIQ